VQTGPAIGPGVFEAGISPYGSDWVIAARLEKADYGVAWLRVHDPFADTSEVVVPPDVHSSHAPLSTYRCPDGGMRLCTGDRSISPWQSSRDPIFIWDIDPDRGFAASNRMKIYSPREDGCTVPHEHQPLADMVKLLPHAGGREQTLIHRVRTCAMAVKQADYPSRIRPLTDGDFHGTAIYRAAVDYGEDQPPVWRFE
jgi:hypothetical protein